MRTLIRFFVTLLVFGACFQILSATPQTVSYQGELTDSNGQPVPDGLYDITFRIYTDSTGGILLWQEQHLGTPVINGRFSAILGQTTPIPDTVFNADVRFLEIQVQSETLVPRTRFTSHPYSFHVSTINGATGGTVSGAVVIHPSLAKTAAGDAITVVDTSGGTLIGVSATPSLSTTMSFYDPVDSKSGIGRVHALVTQLGSDGIMIFNAMADTLFNVPRNIGGTIRYKGSGLHDAYLTNDTPSPGNSILKAEYVGPALNGTDAVGVEGLALQDTVSKWGIGGSFTGGLLGAQGFGWQAGLYGYGLNVNGGFGVIGTTELPDSGSAIGVYGDAGVGGTANSYGVYGATHGTPTGIGLVYAGYFDGDVEVTGTLFKGNGAFKIDHPLDPANKYLLHSFVESPDMKDVYDGVVQLDNTGAATVELPDYFEALNRDFRYQLTAIGGPMPNLYVAKEVSNNSFSIAGGEPGMKVSWQVTGIRHDAFANAHRIPVVQEKRPDERGKYLHPEAFGLDASYGINAAREKQIALRRRELSEQQ